jgi:peroxiredoxin
VPYNVPDCTGKSCGIVTMALMLLPIGRPKVGGPPPALDLPSAGGGTRSLAALRGRPVLVSFLGPAYCNFCRAHVIQTIQCRNQFQQIGADVVLVTYDDPDLVMTNLVRELELPYALLVDTSRQTYRRWGLEQATWRNWLAPGFYIGVLKMRLRGEKAMPETPGPIQMGGDFVVGRDGRLASVHYMKSFHDRAKVPVLLSALASA